MVARKIPNKTLLPGNLIRANAYAASADESLLFDDDYATKWRRATARRLLDL